MIELVPHKCKFSTYGCEEKDYLVPLKNHEEKCPERTVKCPSVKCKAEVQLKKFQEHVQENECWIKLDKSTFVHTISSGFMEWDGESKSRVMMAKNPEEVEQYYANITIYNEAFETSCKCPIIPIEQFPPEDGLIDHEGSWSVHYSLLKKFFYFEDKGENNNHDWVVKYNWKVQIIQKIN